MSGIRVTHIMMLCGLVLTAVLLWFAVSNYRSARPVAHSILRGLALSLGQAIESVTFRDPSFKTLQDFKSADIAYFSVIDTNGRIRFHTNQELVGEQLEDRRYLPVLEAPVITEDRIRLGTGEVVFEMQQQLHLSSSPLVLRLALHTWQADQIIRRARAGGLTVLMLIAAAWSMGLFSLWLLRRDTIRREQLARREHLAQLGELGAVMAHEVRTPLAGIKGYAQLLAEKLDDPRQQRYTDRIVAESIRLELLVNDLLAFARQEPMPYGVSDVEQTVRDVWEGLVAATETSDVTFVIRSQSSVKAGCHPDRLKQLFINLFTNALQVMDGGGELLVSIASEKGYAKITISDSGPGFAAENLPRVFDPFYTTRASGSGLGLAVCRTIAEGYGGSITAANGTAGGAVITLRLPVTTGKEQ